MPPTRERRWWTNKEDEILKNGVQSQRGRVPNWNDIAVLLPDRTNKDCRKRWSKVQLDIRKGAWTRDEDEKLQQAVQQVGVRWSQVATIVQSRNADQCAKRWQHVLGPDFKHSPWTPEEDRKLLDAMTRYRNDWKQIGLKDLPDRSTHDIRNRSLLLERRSRNMLARGSISTQQSSSTSNHDQMLGDEPDKGSDNDNDMSDGISEFGYTGSVGLQESQEPSGATVTRQETNVASEGGGDSPGITHFQQSNTPLGIPEGTGSLFDLSWTGAAEQVQNSQALLTPDSDCFSRFDPLEVSTPTVADSWWTNSPIDDDCFRNPTPLDIALLNVPESSDGSRGQGHIESMGRNDSWGKEKKGNVTLNLSQVDPDVAQEIMGSVLKHSAILKIRCTVNDD